MRISQGALTRVVTSTNANLKFSFQRQWLAGFLWYLRDYLCENLSTFSKCIRNRTMSSSMLHPCIWINVSSHPCSIRSTFYCQQPTVLQNTNCMVNHAITIQPSKIHKVDMPNPLTLLNSTPISVWYVIWCGSTNEYLKNMCSKEIGLPV